MRSRTVEASTAELESTRARMRTGTLSLLCLRTWYRRQNMVKKRRHQLLKLAEGESKGMVVGNMRIATACRQCQDAVCMLCSRAGIARHPNGEVYITESCIGCGICAERCPYGAISIAQIDDETGTRNSWQRFSEFFTKGAGKERARKILPVVSANTAGGNYPAPGPLQMTPPYTRYAQPPQKSTFHVDFWTASGPP